MSKKGKFNLYKLINSKTRLSAENKLKNKAKAQVKMFNANQSEIFEKLRDGDDSPMKFVVHFEGIPLNPQPHTSFLFDAKSGPVETQEKAYTYVKGLPLNPLEVKSVIYGKGTHKTPVERHLKFESISRNKETFKITEFLVANTHNFDSSGESGDDNPVIGELIHFDD